MGSLGNLEGLSSADLDRKLLRASAKPESVGMIEELLSANADPNSRDVTSQLALMVAGLNVRNAEKKCRLLINHKADVSLMYSDSLTVLEWAKERINSKFSNFLAAAARGEAVEYNLTLDAPRELD